MFANDIFLFAQHNDDKVPNLKYIELFNIYRNLTNDTPRGLWFQSSRTKKLLSEWIIPCT